MKDLFKTAAFKGRLFCALALFVCLRSGNAAGIGEPEPVRLGLGVPTAASAIELSAGEFRDQLKRTDLWPVQAVVLDMDGVTTPNSGALWTKHGQEFLRDVAPMWAEGDLRHIKWKRLPDVHRWITENRGARLSYDEYARRREALAGFIYGARAKLESTFLETRDALKAEAVPVALASANTRFSVDSMIRRFHLEQAFDATASSDELPQDKARLGKSQTHLLVCRRLGVSPSRSLAIEDTSAGIEAAKKVGMIVAGFRNGFNDHEDFSSADFVVRRLWEMLALFRGHP